MTGHLESPLDGLDGRIGEAWRGQAPEGSHINVALARRGSPTGAAILGALASPRPGHVPFLACVEPGTLVRPITVVVNKSTIQGETLGRLTWGAAQVGIAQGVLDAVADGRFDLALVDEIVLLVAVWVDPKASDDQAVRSANRSAVRAAISDALGSRSAQDLESLVERRERAASPYFGPGVA